MESGCASEMIDYVGMGSQNELYRYGGEGRILVSVLAGQIAMLVPNFGYVSAHLVIGKTTGKTVF